MINCPVCNDEFDDGFCHNCQEDLFEHPTWFIKKLTARLKLMEEILEHVQHLLDGGGEEAIENIKQGIAFLDKIGE